MKFHILHKKKMNKNNKIKYKPINKHIKSFDIHKKLKTKPRRSKLTVLINVVLICGILYSLGVIIYHRYTNYTADELNNALASDVANVKNQIDYDKLKPNSVSPTITPSAKPKKTQTPPPTKKPAKKQTKATKKPVETANPNVTKSPIKNSNPNSDILPQYQKAYDENNDLIGWIHIDNTTVNYPVLYTKEKDYYARRNFNKGYSDNGSIWLDETNILNKNERDNNLLIYGHNMKSGAMFGVLHGYEDESYYNAHPTIHFDSIYEEGTYDIIATARTEVMMSNDVGFRYYYFTGYKDEKSFNEYMDFLSKNKLYETGIKAEYGDELITLSTCSSHARDNRGRFIVVAKRRK